MVIGRLITPKSFTRVASVELSGTTISCVPPRRAEIIVTSLPSVPLA